MVWTNEYFLFRAYSSRTTSERKYIKEWWSSRMSQQQWECSETCWEPSRPTTINKRANSMLFLIGWMNVNFKLCWPFDNEYVVEYMSQVRRGKIRKTEMIDNIIKSQVWSLKSKVRMPKTQPLLGREPGRKLGNYKQPVKQIRLPSAKSLLKICIHPGSTWLAPVQLNSPRIRDFYGSKSSGTKILLWGRGRVKNRYNP